MDIQWNKLKLKINKKKVLSSGSIKLNGITGIYGDETKNVLLKEIWKRLTSAPKTNKFTTYHNKIKRFEDFFVRISLSPRSLRSQTVWNILSEYYEIKYFKKATINDIDNFLKIFELDSNILNKNFNKLKKKEAAIVSLISELIKGNMIYFIESIDNFLSLTQFVNLIAYFSNTEINNEKTLCFTANDSEFAVSCTDVLIFSKGNVESMYRSPHGERVNEIIDIIELEDNDFPKDSEENDSLKNPSNNDEQDALEEVSMIDSNHDEHSKNDEASNLSVNTTDSTRHEKDDNVSEKSDFNDEKDLMEKENNSLASNQSNYSDESTNSEKRKQKIKENINEPEAAEKPSDSEEEASNLEEDKNANDLTDTKKEDIFEEAVNNTGATEINDTSSITESTKDSPNLVKNSDSNEMEKNSEHSSISIHSDTTTSEINIVPDGSIENYEQNSSASLNEVYSGINKENDSDDIPKDNVSNYSNEGKENISNLPVIVENEGCTDKQNSEILPTETNKENVVEERGLPFSLKELLEENGFVKEELILDKETAQKEANCLIIFHKAIFLAKVFSITKQTYHASFNPSAAKILFNSIWKNFASIVPLCLLSLLLFVLFVGFFFGKQFLIKSLIEKSLDPKIVLAGISTLLFLLVYLPFSSSIFLLSGFLKDLYYDNEIAFLPKTTAIQVIGLFLNSKNLVFFFIIVLYLCIVLGFVLTGPIVVLVLSFLPFCVILEQIYSLVSSPIGILISFVLEILVIFPPLILLFTTDTSKLLLMHAFAPLVSNLNSISAIIVQNFLNSKITKKEVTDQKEIKNLKKLLIYLNKYSPLAKENIKYIVIQAIVVLLLTSIYTLFYLKPLILRRSK